MSLELKEHTCSFLDLVDDCDNVHLDRQLESTNIVDSNFDSECLIPWYLTSSSGNAAIGLLRPAIVDQLHKENELGRKNGLPEVWNIVRRNVTGTSTAAASSSWITFQSWVDTASKRTAVMKELCERWRDTGLFEDMCGPKKWRGEMYAVYSNPFKVHHGHLSGDPGTIKEPEQNYAFEMERSACPLFGVVTYGVHMTIFQECIDVDSGEKNVHIWVPKRSRTKQTWPGYLDNSVAGGISSGMGIFDSIVKEAKEEASVEEGIVRTHAKAVGAVSYLFRTPKGWLQPEVQYVFDLRVPPETDPAPFQPKPLDGEVESFELLPLNQVIAKMRERSFKSNCALVLIDFLIRHGHLTPDSEPDFLGIITRLHGQFDYKKW